MNTLRVIMTIIALAWCAHTPDELVAATFYVSTTGSDSNSCAQAQSTSTPKLTPAAGVACATAAGDTVFFRAGTYSGSIQFGNFTAGGTQANPILISAYPDETVWIKPNSGCRGISHGNRAWITYFRMNVDGSLMNSCASGGNIIHIEPGSEPGFVYLNGHIKDSPGSNLLNGRQNRIAYSTISGTGWRAQQTGYAPGSNGIYSSTGNDSVYEYLVIRDNMCFGWRAYNSGSSSSNRNVLRYSLLHSNGRGKATLHEVGTSTCGGSGGGGVVVGDDDNTIHQNVFYNNFGRNIWVHSSPQGTSAPRVEKNTLVGHATATYGITIDSGVQNAVIINNIAVGYTTANFNNAGTNTTNAGNVFTGSASDLFTNSATNDYTLKVGSAAIGAGTTGTVPCTGVCDAGAFETFTATNASIDTIFLDVSYNPTHGPIQLGGTTGHSVGCTTSCGTLTVASVSVLTPSDTVGRYEIAGWASGECLAAYTITASFNASTGTITDSINIGGTLNQPVHSYGPLSVANNCSEGGAPTPPGTPHRLYELDGNGTDTSGNGGNATVTGSYSTAKYGQGLQGVASTAVRAESDYGSGVDPAAQDLTIVFGYNVPVGAESLTRTIAGAAFSSGNNLAISSIGGTWQINVKDSAVSTSTPSNLPVVTGWNRFCLRVNSTLDTATLTVNNITGTGGASKSYTSYTFGGNIAFGLPSGFNATFAGAGIWDRAIIYTSLIDCNDDWLAWEPASGPSVGSYAQVGARWYKVMHNGAGSAVLHSTASPVQVVQSGAIIHQSQTDCTGGDCSAMGEKLWYTRNGGAEQLVPDVLTLDEVAFYGAADDMAIFTGIATCCISGALTANNGTTQFQNVAQPSIDLAQNASIVRNSVLRFGPTASGTYCFYEKDQNGNALASVTPSGGACVEIIAQQASGGF